MFEINKKRLLKTFTDLVKIPSPSWEEHQVLDYLTKKLDRLNISYKKYKCQGSYNLLARLPSPKKQSPFLLAAHLDTVGPWAKVLPKISNHKITSNGKTILGADDKAAVAMILEALETISEKKLNHLPLEILFTCAEEIGLEGIKNFDCSRLRSKYGFIFDSSGPVGQIILESPYHMIYKLTIKGQAAHAGIEPEKGLNAIKILGEIITKIPSGRIDKKTTINIGTVSGGEATNIVPAKATLDFEIRAIDPKKIKRYEALIEKNIQTIILKYKNKFTLVKELHYPGYILNKEDQVVKLAKQALQKIKIKPLLISSGGGSDANIINQRKIKTVNLSCGMENVHSNKEYILIKDLMNGTKLILALIS